LDSHVYTGYYVPPYYDSLIGKLVAHGDSRESAMARLATALDEIVIDGISTNIPLHQDLCRDASFLRGGTDIHYLERKLGF
jgi:acetyl-CoA carboxylase biotin carboxylase subunit